MIIKGLQKLTLLDYPGKCACTVFTPGCNLRCPFCHNASLVTHIDDGFIAEDEFFKFLVGKKGKLDGVCITGGEPLLQQGVEDFAKKIHDLGFLVKLDTNGTFPDRLRAMIDGKLVDYVAMDVKNSVEKYPLTVGVKDFDVTPVIESIALLKEGKVDYEFRTTVCKELFEAVDFESMAKLLSGAKRCYLQAFKDSGDIIGGPLSAPTGADLNTYSEILKKTVGFVGVRGV